jgi:hypothetical protein
VYLATAGLCSALKDSKVNDSQLAMQLASCHSRIVLGSAAQEEHSKEVEKESFYTSQSTPSRKRRKAVRVLLAKAEGTNQ